MWINNYSKIKEPEKKFVGAKYKNFSNMLKILNSIKDKLLSAHGLFKSYCCISQQCL